MGTSTLSSPTLSADEFRQIRKLAYQHFGLDLKEGKQSLIVARLSQTLRSRGLASFEEYCRHVAADRTGEALMELANALTTNFTSFMREPSHFSFLRKTVAPRVTGRRMNIWSSACSSGEEPYSILFSLLEELGPEANVHVLATDISTKALTAASEAVYQTSRVEGLPDEWRRKYFLSGNGRWQGFLRVKPEYRQRVECRRFNLLTGELPAMKFSVVFCRNVMIYFDKPTQGTVVRRLSSVVEPGGYMFIGHSESLAGVDHQLEYIQPAVYQTPGKGAQCQTPTKR